MGPLLALSSFRHLFVSKWSRCLPKHRTMANVGPGCGASMPAPARSCVATTHPALLHCPRKIAGAPRLAATTHERHCVGIVWPLPPFFNFAKRRMCGCQGSATKTRLAAAARLLYNSDDVRTCLESQHFQHCKCASASCASNNTSGAGVAALEQNTFQVLSDRFQIHVVLRAARC